MGGRVRVRTELAAVNAAGQLKRHDCYKEKSEDPKMLTQRKNHRQNSAGMALHWGSGGRDIHLAIKRHREAAERTCKSIVNNYDTCELLLLYLLFLSSFA